jgi:hypothetical protein
MAIIWVLLMFGGNSVSIWFPLLTILHRLISMSFLSLHACGGLKLVMCRPGFGWKPRLWLGLRRLWLLRSPGQAVGQSQAKAAAGFGLVTAFRGKRKKWSAYHWPTIQLDSLVLVLDHFSTDNLDFCFSIHIIPQSWQFKPPIKFSMGAFAVLRGKWWQHVSWEEQ